MSRPAKLQPIRVGIATRDFHLSGAVDLLRLIIRGLMLRREHQLFLLMVCDEDLELAPHSTALFGRLQKIAPVSARLQRALRKFIRKTHRLLLRVLRIRPPYQLVIERRAEKMYGEMVRQMTVLPCGRTSEAMEQVALDFRLDVILPLPSVLRVPFVGYLYDCQHKYYPEFFSDDEPALRDEAFQSLLDASAALIVNSRDAKNDLIKFFDADPSTIFALPCTPYAGSDARQPQPQLLKRYDLPQKYFLVSNQFWVHKSLETVLAALRILLDEGLIDCRVVFTGKMEDTRFPNYINQFMQTVKEYALDQETRFLGYVPKRDQLEIMKHAVAVIQPTLFEGGPGGGSVYDAVALGVRCIVSDIPINHELPVGDDLVLFEKKNSRDLADKMRDFWQQTDVCPPSQETLRRLENERLRKLSDVLYDAVGQAVEKHHRPNGGQ